MKTAICIFCDTDGTTRQMMDLSFPELPNKGDLIFHDGLYYEATLRTWVADAPEDEFERGDERLHISFRYKGVKL